MNPHQIELVQATWQKIVPIQDTAADLFYGRLFELDPSLRPLFSQDMREQKKKLMRMISTAVSSLSDLQAIIPAVQALGRRHADYKVKPEMYQTVGTALLEALEKGLGEAWNDQVEQAWIETYNTLADVMIAAQLEDESK